MSLSVALRNLVAALQDESALFTVVGGIAASSRGEVRFTRDVDVAVLVHSDEEAESLLFALSKRGYRVVATVEQESTHRLATARLVDSNRNICDLVFATTGIEQEVIESSSELEVFPAVVVPTASVESLLAMKLLSVTEARPRDLEDISNLVRHNPKYDTSRVLELLDLIAKRGYSRGQNLREKWQSVQSKLGLSGSA